MLMHHDSATQHELVRIARGLVGEGRGILAADETVSTLGKRFAALGIDSTETSRRDYRQLFFTAPGVASYISGVILHDETIRQKTDAGVPMPELLAMQGIVPGIKVDYGAKPLAGSPDEYVTEGLDGLRERLRGYAALGARFAKWRAVIKVSPSLPSRMCVRVNAEALARYAALCQEQGIVPIVEPEVLMDGAHTLERCEDVTGWVLHEVFHALFEQGIALEGMLLKPNMIVPGKERPDQASVDEVATATLRCLTRHVPAMVPGIIFLSGGQRDVVATAHLNAMVYQESPKPWTLTFSFGRALQDSAMEAWRGRPQHVRTGQNAFLHRALCNSAASQGSYMSAMETAASYEEAPVHRSDWHDD